MNPIVNPVEPPPPGAHSPLLTLRTSDRGNYPTSPGCAFACDVLAIDGVEAPAGDVGAEPILAVNLGRSLPPPGTVVDGHVTANGRVIFQYDDGAHA